MNVGTKLGPYEIVALIGAGGMGEVYQARDTKLNRDVALKVLPAALAADADRMARFEREAQVLASLNHPNIATIYGLEESNGIRALVMELVEGPTLAERVDGRAIAVEEALRIAKQIAEALEYAHEKGIIHRDLKPANVKLTADGNVKVLDFGLAKALEEPVSERNPSISPTLTLEGTRAGVILGTAGYMAPEQARGAAADKRADIWAFGVVLYEMLAGKPAFTGESISDILAAVLRAEPDWSALPAATPPRIRRLLRRCLERDRKQRLQAIGEARIAIDAPDEEAAELPSRRLASWLVAGALAVALVVAAVGWWRAAQPSLPRPPMRLSVELGPEMALPRSSVHGVLAISPDGGRFVFAARGADGVLRLATRSIDQSRATPLAGTENAQGPFFSPNGDWIGFFADGKMNKISVRGGAPVVLCNAPDARGASWGDDDNIIVALDPGGRGLSRVPAAGGTPKPATELKGLGTHRWPQVLPGSHAVLFNAFQIGDNVDDASIEVRSFKTGEYKTVEHGYAPRYLRSGHLVFVRQNTLFAAPFDLGRLEVTAAPQPVLDDVGVSAYSGAGNFDVSWNGIFIYLSGTAAVKRSIFWMDSSGSLQPLHPEPGQYNHPRFSPDGKRLVFSVGTGHGIDLWMQDLDRGTTSRKTFLPGRNWWPVWTPDGSGIVFNSANGERRDIYWVRADGSGQAQRLTDDKVKGIPRSFSPDGKWLAFKDATRIWTAPMEGGSEHPRLGTAQLFLNEATPLPEAQFSPDGRWIAYDSTESGIADVFVRPFPGPGGQWQISSGGGSFPIWSRSRRELFFLARDQRIMVTPYTTSGNSFSPGTPRVWSEQRLGEVGVDSMYDLAPDGKRFAVVLDAQAASELKPITSATVLLNFFDEVRWRISPGK